MREIGDMDEFQDVIGILAASAERHIKFVGSIEGFTSVMLVDDVQIPGEDTIISAGPYYLQQAMVGGRPNHTVYALEFKEESVTEIIAEGLRRMREGSPVRPDEVFYAEGNMRALTCGDGSFVEITDLIVWYALKDAADRGEEDALYAALCEAEEDEGRKPNARKTEYRRKHGGNVAPASINLAVDALTNALMGRDSGHIEPSSYFTEGAVKVSSGSGGYVMLDVRAGEDVDIRAFERAYQLNDRDRFWLDALYTIALEEGKTEIEGSEILKLRGYTNPYAENSSSTMADAAASIDKAITTRIAIDATHERRKRGRKGAKLTQAISLTPIVGGTMILEEYETEGEGGKRKTIRGFTVRLNGEPSRSLPLAQYAKERGQLTTVVREDYTFKGIGRITTDERQMWSYVLRRIRTRHMSSVIRFDTMWRNLELQDPDVSRYAHTNAKGQPLDKPARSGGRPIDPSMAELATSDQIRKRKGEAIRKQRERIIKKLEKMLDQKSGECFQSWSWHKDANGRVDGVDIVRTWAAQKY